MVDRCHGIACRRFSGRADFRLRRLNGRAARPVIRGHCVGHFCRSGPYYRRGPSGWGRLGSQTRNDGFWQPAGTHSRGRHAKSSPSSPIASFLWPAGDNGISRLAPRMAGIIGVTWWLLPLQIACPNRLSLPNCYQFWIAHRVSPLCIRKLGRNSRASSQEVILLSKGPRRPAR